MPVTNYFLIGNTTVPSSWIALIIAFAIAYGVIRFKFEKHVASQLADYLFYFIIVWKLSVVLTNFKTVIHSPLSIIYFHGGRVGIFLGLIVVGCKIYVDMKKKRLYKEDLLPLFVGSVIIQAAYQIIMVLLNESTWLIQFITIVIFGIFSIFIWFVSKRTGISLSQLAFLFAALHLFVGSFQPAGIFGTSVIATIIMSLFFVLFELKRNYNRREISE